MSIKQTSTINTNYRFKGNTLPDHLCVKSTDVTLLDAPSLSSAKLPHCHVTSDENRKTLHAALRRPFVV